MNKKQLLEVAQELAKDFGLEKELEQCSQPLMVWPVFAHWLLVDKEYGTINFVYEGYKWFIQDIADCIYKLDDESEKFVKAKEAARSVSSLKAKEAARSVSSLSAAWSAASAARAAAIAAWSAASAASAAAIAVSVIIVEKQQEVLKDILVNMDRHMIQRDARLIDHYLKESI